MREHAQENENRVETLGKYAKHSIDINR
jgi:hypothetical protein